MPGSINTWSSSSWTAKHSPIPVPVGTFCFPRRAGLQTLIAPTPPHNQGEAASLTTAPLSTACSLSAGSFPPCCCCNVTCHYRLGASRPWVGEGGTRSYQSHGHGQPSLVCSPWAYYKTRFNEVHCPPKPSGFSNSFCYRIQICSFSSIHKVLSEQGFLEERTATNPTIIRNQFCTSAIKNMPLLIFHFLTCQSPRKARKVQPSLLTEGYSLENNHSSVLLLD